MVLAWVDLAVEVEIDFPGQAKALAVEVNFNFLHGIGVETNFDLEVAKG